MRVGRIATNKMNTGCEAEGKTGGEGEERGEGEEERKGKRRARGGGGGRGDPKRAMIYQILCGNDGSGKYSSWIYYFAKLIFWLARMSRDNAGIRRQNK